MTIADPKLRAKIRAGYPAYTRKPRRGGYRLDLNRIEVGVSFQLPRSPHKYISHFINRTKSNPRGKFAGIKRVDGRQKVGRNKPDYKGGARAKGKLVAPGIRRTGPWPACVYRIEGTPPGLYFQTLAEAQTFQMESVSGIE